MSNHLIVCLVIFVLTCAGYMANVWSIATIAMASVAVLSLTGCLPPAGDPCLLFQRDRHHDWGNERGCRGFQQNPILL